MVVTPLLWSTVISSDQGGRCAESVVPLTPSSRKTLAIWTSCASPYSRMAFSCRGNPSPSIWPLPETLRYAWALVMAQLSDLHTRFVNTNSEEKVLLLITNDLSEFPGCAYIDNSSTLALVHLIANWGVLSPPLLGAPTGMGQWSA